MDYLAAFKDIVSIMNIDYAGFADKCINANSYITELSKHSDDDTFFRIVTEYIREFHDRHVVLVPTSPKASHYIGFHTRRFENNLYVDFEPHDTRLHIGDAIVAIDNKPIDKIAMRYVKSLDPIIERQDFSWILSNATCMTLKGGKTIPLKHFNKSHQPDEEFSYKVIHHNIGYAKLTNFTNTQAIDHFYDNHLADMLQQPNLIIDVRVNLGGADSNYFRLLETMVNKNCSYEEIAPKTGFKFNDTVRNQKNWDKQLRKIMSVVRDENVKAMMTTQLENLKAHVGQGLISMPDEDESINISAHRNPRQVVVLTDNYCGSAGDTFVLVAQHLEKATIMGRNTMGVWDYANVAAQAYGDYTLYYPIMRADWLDDGKGINGVGVKPDIYIPWNPKMLTEDVDIQHAIDFFSRK